MVFHIHFSTLPQVTFLYFRFVDDVFRGSDHKAIMKVMKFALNMNTKEDIKKIYDVVKNLGSPYVLMGFDQLMKNDRQMKRNFFVTEPKKIGNLKPVVTMDGICRAWIPYKASNPYKNSQFITNFEEVFGSELNEDLPNDMESLQTIRFIGFESNYINNLMQSSYR